MIFTKKKAKIVEPDGMTIAVADQERSLFVIRPKKSSVALASCRDSRIVEWHRRLGHLNETDLRKMEKDNMVRGLVLTLDIRVYFAANLRV